MQDGLFVVTEDSTDAEVLLDEASPQALYRFWNADGELLYVGITFRPNNRWKQHMKDKPWWTEIRTITVDQYPTREAVEEAERNAIREERPRYNVVHNKGNNPFAALAEMDEVAATNAARHLRERAKLKHSRSPLDPEQMVWVAEMLDMAASVHKGDTAARPGTDRPPLLHISGEEIWICGKSNDYLYLPQLGFRITFGTGPKAAWTDDDTERLRGADVIVAAVRLPVEWAEAGRIAEAVSQVARSVRVVRSAVGPDVMSHCMAGRRLDELIPVPLPMRWGECEVLALAQELSKDGEVRRLPPKRSDLAKRRPKT